MKKNGSRVFWLTVVALVYAASLILGIWLFNRLYERFGIYLSILIADVLATVFVFLFSLIFRNASVYDPYWSVQPPVILISLLCFGGASLHTVALAAAVGCWAVRLTANWIYNFHGLDYQDWRYKMLKEKTGIFYPAVNLLGIHMFPTLVVYACVLPGIHLCATVKSNPGMEMPLWTLVFCLLIVLATVLQGVADIQMHRFRAQKSGGLMREGLWKNARHPNYLAEISIWWLVALFSFFSCGMPWYFFAGAFANMMMFIFISVPMAENRQKQKVGEEVFSAYKKQTRMFLPIPKKAV